MPEEFKAALLILPLAIGAMEVATQSGLKARWSVLATLASAVVLAWGCAWADWFTLDLDDPGVVTMTGVVAGLMALGVISGGNALARNTHPAPSDVVTGPGVSLD